LPTFNHFKDFCDVIKALFFLQMPNFGVNNSFIFSCFGDCPQGMILEVSSFMLGDSIVSPITQYVVEWHGLFSKLILSLKVHLIG
jgi:hypothetical protein